MSTAERGFLYIAFGEAFTKEALMSIKSLKRYNKEPVALFTDRDQTPEFEGLVDLYAKINPQHIRAKVDFVSQTPFQKTVYLDSDTVVVRNISDMFEVLDRFDVAVTNDYARKRTKYSKIVPEYSEIPYAFSEVNGGIMAYNNSLATHFSFYVERIFLQVL
jgi:lipopolysaccharide biosynthesis glycosyltransferase